MSNNHQVNEKGLLIILSSPSGAGKSTLAQRIKSWDENCVFSISATTRKPREGEQDGKDYYFISEQEFKDKVSNDEIKLMGSPETNYNAKVYDFSGRLVREISFTHKVNINEIDSKGINILTIESDDKKFTKKFKLN